VLFGLEFRFISCEINQGAAIIKSAVKRAAGFFHIGSIVRAGFLIKCSAISAYSFIFAAVCRTNGALQIR